MVALAGLAWSTSRAGPASAHALAQSSNPPAGATLPAAPKAVTIVFSEVPDPHLSSIQVTDTSGGTDQIGKATPVAGRPNTLTVPLEPLGPGVYTVTWRTVSSVDGHLATGSFAFGVKVTPTGLGATANAVRSPPASTWAVSAHWLLYAGLMGLVGVAEIGLLAGGIGLQAGGRRLRWLAAAAGALAVAGVIALEEQQRRADGVPLSGLLNSTLGHQFLGRAIPIAVAIAACTWLWLAPTGRLPLVAVGLTGLGAMLGDVEASHAAGEKSWVWFKVLTQWLHFASAGTWIGGLAVLVAVIRSVEPERRLTLARRFSALALASVVVISATAALRGTDEIRSWNGLFDTTFGRWALLKIGLLVVLVSVGFLNRRSLARAAPATGLRLRQLGAVELSLAVVVLVAAGFLQTLAPPSATAATAAARPLVVSGSDFATTVRVSLALSPGTVGFNRLTLTALDYDTRRPITPANVTLTFTLPSQPALGSSTLTLNHQSGGTYTAVAPNLSVAGTWDVTALIQTPSSSAQVPLTVTPRVPPVKIDVVKSPGLPTVYTIHATPSVYVQVYLDPGQPGLNEFHVTDIGSDDTEVPASGLTVTAHEPGGPSENLTVRRLDDVGHFVSDLPAATKGNYTFNIVTTTQKGQVNATITIPVS
jgi:copper transport protein